MKTGIKKSGIITAIIFCLVFCAGSVVAQNDAQVNFKAKKFPFVHKERNEIVGAPLLDSFFQKLYWQKTANNQRINILQIGDSHIQADFLSAKVRTNFQNDFGNAGRGVVVPLKVAGSNEPFNYNITSNVICDKKRCVFVNDPMPIGIGGTTIQSFASNISFHIRTFDYPPLNYSFKKISLFYQNDSSAFSFSVEDTLGNLLGIISNDSATAFANVSSAVLTTSTNDVVLKAHKNNSVQNNATIFGLNLENDSTGVLYHAVGVNGAEVFQYSRAKYFCEQTQALHPDLIIISLGTNEAQRKPFDKELTRTRIDSLVQQLKSFNPNTPIILTTPPDSYFKRKYYNPAVATMHSIIVEYAKKNRIAVWDLFSATGGYKSCYQWKKYRLMRKDGVHFTREGYELQGNLLYEAIIKSYNNYVAHRHS
jgi:lysophospholipase L1-like esterase